MCGRRLGEVIVKTLNEGGIECVDRVHGVVCVMTAFLVADQVDRSEDGNHDVRPVKR